MSQHEGVSCDSCLKQNFRGKRYKCLICFDYDLCATCYENGATSTRHTADHAMQCILTRHDMELFYGGESVSSEHPQSFSCPYCGKMGFTETTLQEHVNSDHIDSSAEVVCPICASCPTGEPNNVTEDFATHLQVEHRTGREMIKPSSSVNRSSRRAPHPTRSVTSTRTRRAQYSTATTGLSALSPSTRDSMDPIAELLSQLSGVRRATNLGQSHTQLQQLQMQLERHGGSGGVGSTLGGPPNMSSRTPFSDRAPIERVIRRHQQSSSTVGGPLGGHAGSAANGQQLPYVVLMEPQSAGTGFLSGSAANVPMSSSAPSANASNQQSRFLLSRTNESCNSELEQQAAECHKADKSLFVQELLLMTLSGRLSSCEEETTRQEVVSQEPGVTRDHVNDTVSGRSNSLNIPSLNGNDVRLNGGPSSVIDDGDGYHLNITDQANLANIVGNSSVEQNTSSSASQSVSYSDQQSTTPLMVSYSDLYSLELSSSPPHRTATNVNRTSSMTPNQSTGAIRKVPRGSSSAATTTAKN